MMLNAISSANQPEAAVQSSEAAPPTPPPPPAQPKLHATAATADVVQISAGAQAMQEAIESPTQTAKEAASGDNQARHLLARQAAARANS